jgi:hypothetical protein
VVVTDAAGNASEQVVSVAINNLDEIAPSITSGDTAPLLMRTQAKVRLFTQPQLLTILRYKRWRNLQPC